MRALNKAYPDDSDIAALYAASYMSIGRWDYWDSDGNPRAETISVAEALEHIMADLSNPAYCTTYPSNRPQWSLNARWCPPMLWKLRCPSWPRRAYASHIYVRVGQYDKAIDNNVRSQQVDQQFAEIWGKRPLPNLGTYPLSHKMHAGHALDFIRYAATVQGITKPQATALAWLIASKVML